MKTVWVHTHVGSNPTPSAKTREGTRSRDAFPSFGGGALRDLNFFAFGKKVRRSSSKGASAFRDCGVGSTTVLSGHRPQRSTKPLSAPHSTTHKLRFRFLFVRCLLCAAFRAALLFPKAFRFWFIAPPEQQGKNTQNAPPDPHLSIQLSLTTKMVSVFIKIQ